VKQHDDMAPVDPSARAACIELAERDCCSCGRRFQPTAANAPGSLVYCSPRCAWSTESGRSVESLQREHDALAAALAQGGPQKNGCAP
jgi:hypothetical protein